MNHSEPIVNDWGNTASLIHAQRPREITVTPPWYDIELSVPKVGVVVQLYFNRYDKRVFVGYWRGEFNTVNGKPLFEVFGQGVDSPTHWAPLLDPPKL